MTTPRFHTPTGLADLAREVGAHPTVAGFVGAAGRLIIAVLEYEAYTEQQVELAVAEAKRRYPADWADNIREPVGEDDEDWQLDQASHYAQGKS